MHPFFVQHIVPFLASAPPTHPLHTVQAQTIALNSGWLYLCCTDLDTMHGIDCSCYVVRRHSSKEALILSVCKNSFGAHDIHTYPPCPHMNGEAYLVEQPESTHEDI